MPKSPRPPSGQGPIAFVDARGGAFSALAAAIARAAGRGDALAATSSKAVAIPAEIPTVLDEIGATAPEVVPASRLPKDAQRVDVDGWAIDLFAGDGDLERLALARIARDRVERHVSGG
jgi:hypothetical protein